jgi:Uncharacterized protein conserved in bacteria C-term(DUF2220)/Domain of unknown function (DUF4194)
MTGTEPDLSTAVVQLMKGAVYRDMHDKAWHHLLQLQPRVRDYVEVLGVQVVIDEAEGYAFLRQRPIGEDDDQQIPRLIPRRSILNRLRQCFPHACSMLMNGATLLAHRTQWVTEPSPTTTALDLLTTAEQELYRALSANVFGSAVRLEQERVSFTSLKAALSRVGD